MRDKPVVDKFATTFAAGFFVAAVLSAALGSLISFGAPNLVQVLTDSVNAALGAIGIRVAGAVGLEMILSLAGGVSAVWLSARKNLADA